MAGLEYILRLQPADELELTRSFESHPDQWYVPEVTKESFEILSRLSALSPQERRTVYQDLLRHEDFGDELRAMLPDVRVSVAKNAHIGEEVRIRRRELGMTQEALAKEADLRQADVSLLERGRLPLAPAKMSKIAKALGLKPAELRLSGSSETSLDSWQAAEILGIDNSLVLRYAREGRIGQYQQDLNRYVFNRDELEVFRSQPRPAGRPAE